MEQNEANNSLIDRARLLINEIIEHDIAYVERNLDALSDIIKLTKD